MRLLTVGSLPPEWGGTTRGGVATFHASLLAGMLERRGEVEIVGTLPMTPVDEGRAPVPVLARPEGVLRAAFYEELIERLRPDAVLMNHIAHTYGVTHAGLGAAAPPALAVIHSWNSIEPKAGAERERALAVAAEALAGMSAVTLPSRHAYAAGTALGLDYPDTAEVVHNPLQPAFMGDDIEVSTIPRRGALFVGGLTAVKRPEALVRAVAASTAIEVAMVGDGELAGELRGLAARLGLGARLRFVGSLPGPDHLERLRELLLCAAVLCLPSRSESFGLVMIEALACGTPVVGFGPAVREIGEAMGVEVGEPLDEGSPEEIAAAIERVESRRWDRSLLRRAALDAFGLPKAVDRYLELLGRLVATGGRV